MEKIMENATCVCARSYDVETHLLNKNLFATKSITDWLNDWRFNSNAASSADLEPESAYAN